MKQQLIRTWSTTILLRSSRALNSAGRKVVDVEISKIVGDDVSDGEINPKYTGLNTSIDTGAHFFCSISRPITATQYKP